MKLDSVDTKGLGLSLKGFGREVTHGYVEGVGLYLDDPQDSGFSKGKEGVEKGCVCWEDGG